MLRRILAVACGKLISTIIKKLSNTAATAAPGLYALKLDQSLSKSFFDQINKNIVITGTNGKTTTSRLISSSLKLSNTSFIHNRAGSNLERGLVSVCLEKCNLFGVLPQTEIGLWELDEAVFTKIVNVINPDVIVLLNLFRDQLDRYGEVDSTRSNWKNALSQIKKPISIIYNGDDPQLTELIDELIVDFKDHKYIAFGLAESQSNHIHTQENILSPLELVLCPRCKYKLDINQITIVGQGKFKCPKCLLTNPSIFANIEKQIDEINLTLGNEKYNSKLSLQGTYNLYNVIASATALKELGYNVTDFLKNIIQFKSAFGRLEEVKIKESKLIISLIKNPTGFIESLNTTLKDKNYTAAIFILNDNFADGKDVSWIWDVPIGKYLNGLLKIYVSGNRSFDMALRLKYASVDQNKIQIISEIDKCIESAISTDKTTIPVFATYTAMLDIQKHLQKTGIKKSYLEG